MSHSFKVSVTKDLAAALKEVEDGIVSNGGTFKGDLNGGEFSGKTILGMIHGEYKCLSDDEVEITITKKPFAAPSGKIEAGVREYFS